MKLRDPSPWWMGERANQDSYGHAVYAYAKRWADLMEERMSAGAPLSDIAKEASYDADTECITGFMYGCAVAILSIAWWHGEELRRWHNIDAQIGDEGERANASGGALNPSLLSRLLSS